MRIFEVIQKAPAKVLYHGTGKVFDKFQQSEARSPNDYYGGGVAYFTDDYEIAVQYAHSTSKRYTDGIPTVYTAQVNIKNHFDVDETYSGKFVANIISNIDSDAFARAAGLLRLGAKQFAVLSALERGDTELTGDQIWKGISANNVKTEQARKILQASEFDGLRYTGGIQTQGKLHNVWLPYDKSSIKILKTETLS